MQVRRFYLKVFFGIRLRDVRVPIVLEKHPHAVAHLFDNPVDALELARIGAKGVALCIGMAFFPFFEASTRMKGREPGAKTLWRYASFAVFVQT
jgi:hypothetical protein